MIYFINQLPHRTALKSYRPHCLHQLHQLYLTWKRVNINIEDVFSEVQGRSLPSEEQFPNKIIKAEHRTQSRGTPNFKFQQFIHPVTTEDFDCVRQFNLIQFNSIQI